LKHMEEEKVDGTPRRVLLAELLVKGPIEIDLAPIDDLGDLFPPTTGRGYLFGPVPKRVVLGPPKAPPAAKSSPFDGFAEKHGNRWNDHFEGARVYA
jgi:hypothetical protein